MAALLVAAIVAEIPWQLLGNEISPFFIYNVRLFVLMVSSDIHVAMLDDVVQRGQDLWFPFLEISAAEVGRYCVMGDIFPFFYFRLQRYDEFH